MDLADIARSCGLRVWAASDEESLSQALQECLRMEGPCFVRAKISTENLRVPFLLDDPAVLRHTFESFLREGTG